MANPLYGQNKADNAIDYGKSSAIILDAATTLTASQSGSTVLWNVAAAELTLPAAEAGLNFKVIIGVDATAGCTVVAASGDCFFGQIKVVSTTAAQTEIQDIDYATAKAETTYGICGIKVWINKGEILVKDPYGSEKNQIEQGSVR